MRSTKAFLLVVSAVGVLAIAPPRAQAEPFLDLYVGAARTGETEVTIQEFLTPATASRTVDFDSSVTFGGRIGYWFEGLPWVGVALDVSSFKAEGQNVDIAVFPVSILVMLRWALLATAAIPQGRVQPYVGIGPGVFISDVDVDFRPAVAEEVSDWSLDLGLDVRAGLAWQFHKRVAIFAEYRFTHVGVEIEERGCITLACALSIFGSEVTVRTTEATLDTHHFLLGLSFRF